MSYPFVQARHFRAGGNTPVNRIVLHDMEYPEKLTAAEDVANYFARTDKKASAHYCCDSNSTVQCVRDGDIAFHAPPNTGSIGIEQAGYARQTPGDWADPYSNAMIHGQVIPLVRLLCREHNVPMAWLSVQDLRDGKRGITSHNNVSLAFGASSHTDPGPNYPYAQFMLWLTETEDPDVPLTPPELQLLTNASDQSQSANVRAGENAVRIDRVEAKVDALGGGGTPGLSDADIDRIVDRLKERL